KKHARARSEPTLLDRKTQEKEGSDDDCDETRPHDPLGAEALFESRPRRGRRLGWRRRRFAGGGDGGGPGVALADFVGRGGGGCGRRYSAARRGSGPGRRRRGGLG